MKKSLLLAALTLMSASAFASSARVSALQSAAHLSDATKVLTNPDEATKYGEWALFEFGATAAANGGFVRGSADSAWGFYLGNNDTDLTRSAGFLALENPFNVFYGAKAGDMTWGLGLLYSNSDKKTTSKKQTAQVLTASMTMGDWDASLKFGLANTADGAGATTDTYKGKSLMDIKAGYKMDNLYFYGQIKSSEKEVNTGAAVVTKGSVTKLGVVNSMKKDGADFFYGAAYSMTSNDVGGTKTDTTEMPVIIGVEADAASWMVLRASLTQNVLLGTTKTTVEDTTADNTTVAAGLGMKWNKWTLDGVLSAGTTGNFGLDGANFMSNASLTYMF
ncbi:MAG TPA: hypothetical protein PLJ21_04925 [Pseudobdellovibrionaceae bacterium]|nr:hypothetical protein [Pseudobdellovibrionaceae bacterium]